jgi:hypothetical protein
MTCGPGKLGDKLVPDSPLGFRLHKCCEKHDKLYAKPEGRTRAMCDLAFYSCVTNATRQPDVVATHPALGSPHRAIA